ncbi:MAG: isoprenylcysteine carboxylmethyltransferase family protein [bacterium]
MNKSFLLVFFQISSFLILAFTGSIFPSDIILLILGIIFLLFGFWAIAEMKFRFNVLPELLKNSSLVTSGPFKFVRHPIYTSLILITLIWIINDFSFMRLGVWILLFVILNIKLEYEEKILTKQFPEYKDYKRNTNKLIPFIY